MPRGVRQASMISASAIRRPYGGGFGASSSERILRTVWRPWATMQHRGGVELIAHRAGNLADLVSPAAQVADVIEIDVHLFRTRLEVRHAKILLWPFARLWEKWEILPSDAPRPHLDEILAAVPAGTRLWFDLKAFTSRVPSAVHRVAGDLDGATYSARQWWVLRWVRRNTSARTMRSVGNRWQRWLVTKVHHLPNADGIVIRESLLEPGVLERLRTVTPTVIAWGVHDRARADELIAAGISGLILDDLELLRALRQARDATPA
jgi:hypothetical protein